MPTLKEYRQAIADELKSFAEGTATSGSTPSMLECAAWPIKSAIDRADEYKDRYLLRPEAVAAADRVRLVKDYDPANGHLTPDLVWANSPYADGEGEPFELHGIVEPYTEMRKIINRVLKYCPLVVEFTGTPTADKTRHALTTAAPWLKKPAQVRQVGYLASGEDRNKVNPFDRIVRGVTAIDGNTVILDHPTHTFAATETLYVLAVKPAYFHCRASGGAWGEQSGLALDTDEAMPTEEWVTAGALIEVWRQYGHLLEQQANTRLIRDRAEAAAWFESETYDNVPVPAMTFRPHYAWGPTR